MNTKVYRRIAVVLLIAVVMAISACGTLQIESEPPEVQDDVAGPAPEVTRATKVPVVEETAVGDVITPTPTEASVEDEIAVETAVGDAITSTPTEASVEVEIAVETAEPLITISEIKELDETWNLFTDFRQGFSIKFPKKMATFRGSCTWNEERGSFRPVGALVPVTVFEDENSVFIAAEHNFELAGERQDGGATYYDECNLVNNSLELLRDLQGFEEPYWEISVEEVLDEVELESFIKERYGSGCSLGEQMPSLQDGVYDVKIDGDGKGLEVTQCDMKIATVIKYYPAGNKVAVWDRDQFYKFPADVNYTVNHDQDMEDSFRFLTDTSIATASESETAVGQDEYDTTGWKTYTNETIGYSLMFPADTQIVSRDHRYQVAFIGPEVDGKPLFQFIIDHGVATLPEDANFMQDLIDWQLAYLDSLDIDPEGMIEEVTIAGEPAIRTRHPGTSSEFDLPRDDYHFMHGNLQFGISISIYSLENADLNNQILASLTFD